MTPCDDLVPFADGAFTDDLPRAAAFREHLSGCTTCQDGLTEALALSARLSTLGE